MALRVRRFSALTAVLAVAAVLVPVGIASRRDSGAPALPTLYVVYAMNCTFSIVDDFGRPVSSIAPGTYQVEVSTPVQFGVAVPGGPSVVHLAPNDFTGCKGWVQFQLTGPGVNLSTTLDAGCNDFSTLPATSFQAGSTYTAEDLNQPSVARATFTTLASGSPAIPKSPYGPTSGKGTASTDLAGSGVVPFRGTLTGTLSANGKPTLTSKGKPVSILKAGSYKFAITDQDPKGGFTLQATQGKPKDLTGVKFTGKQSVTVTLKAGRWAYSSSPVAYNFLVIG